jgi:hypothetical protein
VRKRRAADKDHLGSDAVLTRLQNVSVLHFEVSQFHFPPDFKRQELAGTGLVTSLPLPLLLSQGNRLQMSPMAHRKKPVERRYAVIER